MEKTAYTTNTIAKEKKYGIDPIKKYCVKNARAREVAK
jgi:hypothetical protein